MSEKNKLQYDAEQIRTAEGREHVRMRPSMYIGSTANPNHLAIEIMANSIDEAMNGHGDNIIFEVSADRTERSVSDSGRGIPVNTKRDDGLTTLEASFSILNTSGKFDQKAFQSSIGTNGIGGKATNFLSEVFKVRTVRNGEFEALAFNKGILVDRKVGKTSDSSGVSVSFKADAEIFSSIKIDIDKLRDTLEQASYLNKNVKFTIIDKKDNSTQTFVSKNGLADYLVTLSKGTSSIIKNPLYLYHKEEGASIELSLGYNDSYNETIKTFANTGYTPDNGTHLTAVRTCLTRQLNNYANEHGLFKSNEKNLTGKEYGEGLVLVLNVNMAEMGYDGQTKTKVTDTRIAPFANPILNQGIQDWLMANPKDAKAIIDKALTSRRANEAAKKAKDKVQAPKKQSLKARMQVQSKLTDATQRNNRQECELMIVEGDSAGGSAKQARIPKTQAVLPVRGKSLNAQKASVDRILANQEYVSLINAIGANFGKNFDIKKSRYGKIILMSDADVDGSHIQILLLTFFYNYMRPLIEEGMIYFATPPLYRATIGSKIHYIRDEEELEEFRKKHSKFELSRFKGLGEMNPEQLRDTTVDPENRVLQRVTISDAKSASALFEDLMGKEVEPRRDYIFKNAEEIVVEF